MRCNIKIINKKLWKMLGQFATASRFTLPFTRCRASMSTTITTTTTTTRDRGDRYGPMEWAQSRDLKVKPSVEQLCCSLSWVWAVPTSINQRCVILLYFLGVTCCLPFCIGLFCGVKIAESGLKLLVFQLFGPFSFRNAAERYLSCQRMFRRLLRVQRQI